MLILKDASSNISGCPGSVQKVQYGTEWYRMVQNDTEWNRMNTIASKVRTPYLSFKYIAVLIM